MDPIAYTGAVTAEVAQAVIEAATKKATELGVRISVAVADAGGNLKAFLRMDGAEIAGPYLAQDKAFTAVAVRCATAELAEFAQSGQPLFGLNTGAAGRLVIYGGGVPLVQDGVVVGGVGVSGCAEVDQDVECANAAAAAFA
jgi:uncharacterized protein GlcG (DUF336 family)